MKLPRFDGYSYRLKGSIRYAIVASCVLLSISCRAAQYQYYPNTTLTLGGSFSPLYPTQAYPPCLTFTVARYSIDHGAPKTEFTASEVRTRQELYHQLHIDATLSATSTFASGSASFSLDEKYHFEADDAYFTLRASSDYGRFAITNPQLTDEARALIHDKDAFERRCGTEFVYQERRVAQIVAVYSFQHVTEAQQKQLAASMSASGFGISFGGNYSESGSSANEKTQVTVDIYAIGGQGIQHLSEITSADSLKSIKDILEQYISEMGPDQAAPTEFITGSWESFDAPVPLESMELRNVLLPELYFSFRDTEVSLNKLGAIIRSANRPRSKISQSDLVKYQQQYGELSSILQQILEKGRSCLAKEANCLPPFPPVVYKVDWPQAIYETRWFATDENGSEYKTEIVITAWNLGKTTTQGSFSLNMANSRIADVDYVCTDAICGYSYNRDDAKGYQKDVEYSADRRSFTWYRRWGGDRHEERYVVHYEVQRTVCVENCDYQMKVQDANSKAIRMVEPGWNYSKAAKRSTMPKP